MKNSNYWKKRFEILEKSAIKKGAAYYDLLDRQYREANKRIESQISTWYQRFANNNQISLADARRLLNSTELEELQWSVEEYIKHGEENALTQEWIKELENASAKVHISRLESLKLQMQQEIEALYGNQLDDTDKLARDIYSDNYYHTAFEIQKGFNLGWTLHSLDTRRLDKVITKPWTLDGRTFSDKIWTQKNELIATLHTELTQAIIRGDAPDRAIKTIADKFKVAKNKAGRLVMTESAYFASVSQKDCFNDLDVERFEIVATLDSHTSPLCQSLDGKVQEMKDFEPGVTAPPFHPWCRTTTVPYFDDDFGERAARGADGKTYYVPSNMKYGEWKEKFVDNSPVKVEEVIAITKKNTKNDYSVNRTLVNSKEFHDKFENLTTHKEANESIYRESMKILEHRDGTDGEDLIALDARTGKVIVSNTSSTASGKTGFTKEQHDIFSKHRGEVILLHNHPNSSRPSFTDISTMFKNDSVVGSIAVGHNGTVHFVNKLKNIEIDIDKLWNDVYNSLVERYQDKTIIKHKALDAIYDFGVFNYESR